MLTQAQIANQMIRQLRILDPSVSADLGTPERKLLDSVAEALASAQIDLSLLSGAFDIDAKYGTDLDRFLAIFAFARQAGTHATGVVEFSRTTPSSFDIRIPAGSQLVSIAGGSNQAVFATSSVATLPAGDTSVFVPIRSTVVGSFNNVSSNTITTFVGEPLIGITGVNNSSPTVGGRDPETDSELKVRFRNTLFRNVAGTEDQYLALAVSGAFTNKANVVGPISRYREYIQVPQVDDASAYDVSGDSVEEPGNGNAGEYTTALSTIPYAEYTYDTVPVFVSNGATGATAVFYTEGVDFDFNSKTADKNRGDTYRLAQTGGAYDPIDAEAQYQPNITLLNVYTGISTNVEAVRPGDILLLEHSYISSASRNDFERNITNCVDVYVNGSNTTRASTVIPRPSALVNQFVNDASHRYHFNNYRRIGEPQHRPILGNVFTPLFWNPLIELPDSLLIGGTAYTQGVHYWAIEDVSDNGGTVRARTGIEWSVDVPGQASGDPTGGPYSGPNITANDEEDIAVEYFFDKNIIDLQSSIEATKQVTTDVLVHRTTTRFLKFDITVMYVPGAGITATNNAIRDSVQGWLNNFYFGGTVQLSDVLQIIHNTGGVDNVRWSAEVSSSLNRVIETDIYGNPYLGLVIDRVVTGTPDNPEIQQVYIEGEPDSGSFILTLDTDSTEPISYNATLAEVNSLIDSSGIPASVVSGDGTPASPFRILFDGDGAQELFTAESNLGGGSRVFNTDFYLKDDELPSLPSNALDADTVPGLIIRPRAQSTWGRS